MPRVPYKGSIVICYCGYIGVIAQYSHIFQISIGKGFGGKRPVQVGSYELGKKKGLGFRGPKGSNRGPRSNRRKKRLCFFGKLKIQQIYRPQKKAYI
jgi:hypothetical protein